MSIPNDQLQFFLHPIVMIALAIGVIIIVLIALSFISPHIQDFFRLLFKVYYYLAMAPLIAVAFIVFGITLGKVNIVKKLKEVNFFEKFKRVYLQPNKIFEDMRKNPTNYRLWEGVYVCAVFIFIDYFLITTLSQLYANGNDNIVFGLVSTKPPGIPNPYQRWLYKWITGIIVWIPTKFAIYFLVLAIHKYDKTDEPKERPWYDKARLTYIAWGYIIAADSIWCLGMIISLLFSIIIPSWEVLIFTWVFVIICGLVELTYQQFSLHRLFKLSWSKGFLIWLLSMIPAAIANYLLVDLLGPIIFN